MTENCIYEGLKGLALRDITDIVRALTFINHIYMGTISTKFISDTSAYTMGTTGNNHYLILKHRTYGYCY